MVQAEISGLLGNEQPSIQTAITSASRPGRPRQITQPASQAPTLTGAPQPSASASGRRVPQAKDWVGIPVAKTLGLDLGTKTDRAKVRALLEMWLRAGSLCEEEEHDEKQRRKKKFIKVTDESRNPNGAAICVTSNVSPVLRQRHFTTLGIRWW